MNRRDFFLSTLMVLVNRSSAPAQEVAIVMGEAWRLPEEAIPREDPAQAALEFYRFNFEVNAPEPAWLAAHEESRASAALVPAPFE